MFALKPRKEIIVRVLLVTVILFNAFSPNSVFAKSAQTSTTEAASETSKNEPRSVLEEKPLYFTPPQLSFPEQTSPEPDKPKSPIPPKDSVEFSLTAEPVIVPSNGQLQFNVRIRNNSDQILSGLIFTDHLESGLEYSQNAGDLVSYDVQNRDVTLMPEDLGAGDEVKFTYSVTVTASKRNSLQGKIWLHDAVLKSNDNSFHLKTNVAFGVGVSAVNSQSEIVVLPADGGWNDLGRMNLYMEKNNVGANALVMSTPTKLPGKGPELQFKLDVFETSPIATDATGDITEQEITISGENQNSFAKPAFLEINLDGYIDLRNVPAGQEPYVATYAEETKVWVKVPILEQNYESNSVLVSAAHFSTWGAGLGSSLPQNGANVLLFDQPYTSLFTGAARYSIPIWTPPGRGGMQPDVSLSYSSGTVDGVLGDVQAPWVGMGWNMDAVEVVRKITTDENGYGYRNEFALTLNGALYQLVRDEIHQNRYYTDQAAFLYVDRHNYAFNNTPSTVNTTGEWWEVVTTDGTRYRLGWNNDSEQLALMYGYSCTTNGLSCITPDGAYASLGYAGKAKDLVAMRWRVDKVTDTHGNYMSYQYTETQPTGVTTIAAFDRESYLDSISYTGFTDPDGIAASIDPGYQVKFTYASRSSVGDIPVEFNMWDNIDSKLLSKIEILCLVCTITPNPQSAIRMYEFGYSLASAPNANGTLTLSNLKITGGGYTENGQSIPTTYAPTIRFTYQNKPNRATGNGDVFNYPRLTVIENGSGGKLTFTYETDGRDNSSWFNYRVQNVVVDSGIGTAKKQSYTYATPVYSGQGGNPNLGGLIGYTTVTESVLDFNNNDARILDTRHTFGTIGLDVGRELQTELLIGGTSTVLQKSSNVYVTDNSQAPFPGWNYRYLGESASYVRSGSGLVLTSKSTYFNDPATGNPLVQSTYLGSSLYRKMYYEYVTNPDPAYYILGTVSRVLLVNASNQIYSDTRYHYDGGINRVPTRGDLTLVQKLTGNPEAPNETVDLVTHFTEHGNVDFTRTHKSYGSVNIYPTSEYQESQTGYDETFRTYPVTVTDPLGNISTSSYLFTSGVPYQSTDPNQWTTKTTYDGLGRTLSVTPPGLTQPGTWFTYPAPDSNGNIPAPHSVDMQILDTIAGKYRSVWGIYDGAGRMIQTQVQKRDGLLVNTTVFNAQGLVQQQSLPYTAIGSGGNRIFDPGNQFTLTEYDALGRVTKVTAPGNIVSQTSYDGLTTTSLDPNNNKVSRTTDGLGRMTAVAEFSNIQTVYATTQYFYDAADRLIQVKDGQFNSSIIQYDWLGRKKDMDDPDMGVWSYRYDPFGNMSMQIDARNEQLTFQYDDLNRLVRKMDDDPNTSDITYSYGSIPGLIGFRIGMSDASGSTVWGYSDFGRTVVESRTIGGETQSITTNSDWLGRPISTTYSDGEIITYTYDELGRPRELKSNQSTVSLVDIAYNVLGQITTQALGNGTIVENSYENTTTRLSTRTATKVTTGDQLDLSYTYDSNGNITRLTDNQLGETHFYQYDFLNRLTSAVAGNGVLTNPPATPQVYGQQFAYDKVGNMLQMNNWGTPPTQLAFQNTGGMELANQNSTSSSQAMQDSTSQFQLVSYKPAAIVYQVGSTDTPTSTSTPTLTITPTLVSTSSTFTPIADAYIQSGSPNTNAGSDSTLQTDNSPIKHILIKFTVSGLNGQQVTNAKLRLYNVDASSKGGDFYRVANQTWQENTVTWNNTPAADPTQLASLGSVSKNTWYEVNITSLITGDGTYSLRISSTSSDGADYSSKEGANPPQLVVTYLGATATPTPTFTSTATFTSTSTQTFTPTATDTPTQTPTNTLIPTNTPPATSTPSATSTFTPTKTPTPVTSTPTKTLTPSSTPTRTPSPTSTPGLPQSLIAYWSFDNVTGTTAPDSATGGSFANNATLVNGPVIQTTGAQGSSVFFDGVNDYASVTDQAEIKQNGSFTVSAWINPSAVVTNRTQYIVNKGVSATDFDYGFITTTTSGGTATPTPPANVDVNGKLVFRVGDLTPNKVIGPVLPINTWTLVTGTYDSFTGELRLYINGTLSAVEKVTGTVSMGSGILTFSGVAPNQFSGGLDEIRFYNRALTSDEVTQLFGTFNTPTPLPSITPTATSVATLTPTATPMPISAQQWGTGADGDLNIVSGQTYNLNVQNHAGRTCVDGGDGVAYNVTTLGSTVAILSTTPSSGCLNPGDEVMLVQLTDVIATNYNAGSYEFLRVAYLSGNNVAFTTDKTKWYGNGFRSDMGIGVATGQLRVMLIRVPNYNNITVNGTLKANAFDGNKYGVVAFRILGTLNGTGVISASQLGFNNGSGYGAGSIGGVGSGGGGGSHGTQGTNGIWATAGSVYGEATVKRLYLGSSGGDAGTTTFMATCGSPENNNVRPCQQSITGPLGAQGGGIVFVSAQTINFSGGITAVGEMGRNRYSVTDSNTGAVDYSYSSGGGSGGTIRIEGGTVNLGTVNLAGGAGNSGSGAGGQGRIAVYYQTSASVASTSTPPYISKMGQAGTPTPTSTPLTNPPSPYGSGKDGNLVVNAGQTTNLSTQNSNSRTCADGGDGVAYAVTLLTSSSATVSNAIGLNCLQPSDEVLLIHLSGTGPNLAQYEFLRVGGVSNNIVYFTTLKINYYGDTVNSDANIGTGTGQQRVMLIRVPNYNNMTVNGTLKANAFDGNKYGVVAFRILGTLNGTGIISASQLGFNNGSGYGAGSIGGVGSGGGGGSHGTQGTNGIWATAGSVYGEATVKRLYLGSSGGDAGTTTFMATCGSPQNNNVRPCQQSITGPLGAQGGGILFVSAQTINFGGSIASAGEMGRNRYSVTDSNTGAVDYSYSSGGGSGGSVRIEGGSITLSTVSAASGAGNSGSGAGGLGRIAIYYSNSFTNSATICAQASTYCKNTSQIDTPTPAPTVTVTPTSAPSTNPGKTGLVSWWTLNETTSTRYDNHGTNHLTDSDPDGYTVGMQGNAATFTAANHKYLGLADNAALSMNNTNFTIAAWVKLNSKSNHGDMVIKWANPSPQEYALIYNYVNDRFDFYASPDGVSYSHVAANNFGSPATGVWYYVTAWYDGTSLKISVNNGAADSISYTSGVFNGSQPFRLGDRGSNLSSLDGALDEVALYKRALTSAERTWLYNNGNGRTYYELDTLSSGWYSNGYIYAGDQPHAVTSIDRVNYTDSFTYDENGNMICRTEAGVTYKQIYNAENRISAIHRMNGNCLTGTTIESWTFVYDGDGVRVSTAHFTGLNPTPDSVTRYYFGGAVETTGSSVKKYYSFAGQTIAMKDANGLQYFLTDHLGSIVATLDSNGTLISQQRYLPFGAPRTDINGPQASPTDFGYTGQRKLDSGMGGIMDYKARFFSPYINHFLQPDSIIPNLTDPQSLNRYGYVQNNPVRFNDPTGHMQESESYIDNDGKCDSSDKGCNDVIARIEKKKNPPKPCATCHVPTSTTTPLPTLPPSATSTHCPLVAQACIPTSTSIPSPTSTPQYLIGPIYSTSTPSATPMPNNEFPVDVFVPSIFSWPPNFAPSADDIWDIVGGALPLINQPATSINQFANNTINAGIRVTQHISHALTNAGVAVNTAIGNSPYYGPPMPFFYLPPGGPIPGLFGLPTEYY